MSQPSDAFSPTSPRESRFSPAMRSGIFVLFIGGVFALFSYMSSLEGPPNLLNDINHRLRFNHSKELIGLASETVDPITGTVVGAGTAGADYNKKAIEKRINTTCASCHGAAGQDLTNHPCQALGKCIPPHHPPKTSCIKCHRAAPGAMAKPLPKIPSAAKATQPKPVAPKPVDSPAEADVKADAGSIRR